MAKRRPNPKGMQPRDVWVLELLSLNLPTNNFPARQPSRDDVPFELLTSVQLFSLLSIQMADRSREIPLISLPDCRKLALQRTRETVITPTLSSLPS